MAVTPAEPGQVDFALVNPAAAAAQVRVQVGAEMETAGLNPGAHEVLNFWFPITAAQGSTGLVDLPVSISWNGHALGDFAPVTLVPVYPIGLSVVPCDGGVGVSVTNRLLVPFQGQLKVISGGHSTGAPISIAPGGTEEISEPVNVTLPIQAVVTDGHKNEVARLKPTHFLPLTGFPAALTDAVPFNDVEFVHDVPDSKGPLNMVATQPGSPAPIALTLPYRDGARWLYTQAVPTLPGVIPAGATGLDLWVYAHGTGQSVTCRFRDATGQTFQPHLADLTWTGWKLVHIPFYGDDHYSWGGAADGIPHGALSWVGLINVDGQVDSGGHDQIMIAGPVYEIAD